MTEESRIIYPLDSRPPPGRAVVLGLQHVLTMFGATVSVPLLFGPALWPVDDPSDAVARQVQMENIATLISSVMLCSGLATLIQATFGSRLPIIQGVSFSFLTAFFTIIASVGAAGGDGAMMMRYIAGAILVGAAIEIFIGFSGLMGWLRRFLSPVVVGPVIMLIGLALFQHGAPKAGTHWPTAGLTIVLVILFSLVLSRKNRLFQLFPILMAVLIACGVCWACSASGTFGPTHPAYVNLSTVEHARWLRANPADVVFPWGLPKFQLGFIVAVLAGYMASMIESFGDYHACSQMAGGGDPSPKQISRGIGCEGIGCALTGLFGGFSSTSYSENIGLIGLTKVGSRYVVQIAGVILVLLGLFGKFGAIAAAIPGPVVGGLYCALFGLISAVGIQQLARADLKSDRNLFIAGFSLFMGLSLPAYFLAVADPADIAAGKTLALYHPTGESLLARLPAGLSGVIVSIGSTGMAVGAIIGIILDNLIPGTPQERGLVPTKRD
ncbi:MAG: purine/pyrimidine permease [Planctomycetes bacterium]|nr:purine/pyrimidine permease [Planctomycetota bacterium]